MADAESDNEPRPFTVSMDSKEIPCNRTGSGPVRLIFTHGAGGTITSDGMGNFSAGFSKPTTSSVICFQGNMNLKSRVKMFDAVHDNVISTYRHETPIALGGRSMGARAAVLAAMEDTKCLILASYPLQTDKEVRDQILLDLPAGKRVLFISGDQDSMCDLKKLNEVRRKMKAKTWLIRVRDADHGMNVKPKKATKVIGEETGIMASEWLREKDESKTEREVWWGEDEQGKQGVHSGTLSNYAELKPKKETKASPSKPKKTGSSEEGTKRLKESKAPPSKSKGLGRGEEGSKSSKETKAIPARVKKADSNVKDSKDRQDAVTDPTTNIEPRRSKRRKVE